MYVGPFFEGKKDGWGKYTYMENGGSQYNTYVGEFKNDKPYGWGVRRTAVGNPENDPYKEAQDIKGVTFGYNAGSTKYMVVIDDKGAGWVSNKSPYSFNIFAKHA